MGRKIDGKNPVEESSQTKKARLKLQKKLEEQSLNVTPTAIREKSKEIEQWIARHADSRVPVEKEISLFDRNQNSVQPSRSILKMAADLASKEGSCEE